MSNALRFVNIAKPPRPAPTQGLLLVAVGHVAPKETPVVAARLNLALLDAGIAHEIAVVDASGPRILPVPTPPAAPTLQDLVKRGRRQLLAARHQARQIELGTLQTAVKSLRASIQLDR